ncbi:hypothetical protein KW791_00090 [Candidatus Parcubacteria bacterium]|nr:hypothetical protein [Candidatus Parcubacteria bacterium]
MFMRETHDSPKEQYYADSLLTKPTTSHSAFNNFAAGLVTPNAMMGDVNDMFSQKAEGKPLRDFVNSVEIMNQEPDIGWGQASANYLSNMIGYGLNPLTWGFGAIGGGVAEAAIGGAAKVAPEAAQIFMRRPLGDILGEKASKYLPQVADKEMPLSLAILGEKYTKSFGTLAGAGVPAAEYANYNADTKHINWGGAARDMSEMGLFGLAIESIPFAWGVLKSRINRGIGKPIDAPIEASEYQKAFDNGIITKDEFEWINDYHNNPLEADKLQQRATKILADNGHPVNTANHEVPFPIVDSGTVDSLKSALLDQSLADVPEESKTALSDYLVHNSIDNLRENPQALDGVRGFVEHINQKLIHRPEQSVKADKIMEKYMLKGLSKDMPMSQENMYKEITKLIKGQPDDLDYVEKAASKLPVSVPENIINRIYQDRNIEYRQSENKQLFKKYEKTGNQKYIDRMKNNEAMIKKVNENLRAILTPAEELLQIKDEIFKTKLGINEPDYYHISPETYEEGQALKSLFSKKGVESLKDFLEKWRYDLFEGDLPLVKSEIKVLKEHPKLVFLFKKGELDSAINWLRNNKGRVNTDIKKNKLLGIYDAANELKTYERLGYKAVPHEIPAKYIKEITGELYHNGLKEGFDRGESYNRLLDLSNVWENAKTLLDRVHLEAEYERQAAYRDLASSILQMADSDVGRFADRNNVTNYLRDRIDSKVWKKDFIEGAIERAREAKEVPANADEIVSENENQVSQSNAPELSKEFDQATEKYKEFKGSEGIFKNLIQCVIGSLNGQA